jgi:hypothetical protein
MKIQKLLILFIFVAFCNYIKAQSVSITSSASGAVCAGTNITFTAVVSNISSPTYQWYKNNIAINGATSSTYSTTTLNNNDQIYATATPAVVTASLITSNLISNVDAGNTSSYTGTGGTWTDLTGKGNKVTFSGSGYSTGAGFSSVNGGGILFNTSKYGTHTVTSPPFSGDFTWSTILKAPDPTTNGWDFIYNIGGYNGFNIGLISGQPRVSWGTWFTDNINVSGEALMIAGNYYMLTFVRSGNTLSCYLQANRYGTSGTVLGGPPAQSPFIGRGPGGEWWENGMMNVLLLYNRALSQTEITQNYNTYASRFGLAAAGISSNTISTTISPAPSSTINMNGDGCMNKTSLTTTSGLTSYVWYKDDVMISGITTNTFIPNASGAYHVIVTNGTCSSTSTATTIYTCGINADGKAVSIANISSLISREGGAYLGTAKDISGKNFNTTTLTTLGAATIGSTSAILGGVITGTNGRSSGIGVVYSTDPNFGTFLTTSISTNVAAGTYTSTITGLTSSTKYYAKSFIVNASGTNYGSAVDFTTTVPPVVPASFSFSTSNLSGNLPNYYLATNNLTLSQLPTSWTIQWTYRLDESIPSADGMHWFFIAPGALGKYYTDMHLYQLNGALQFWYNKNNYTSTETIMTGLSQGTVYKIAISYDGTNLRTYSNGTLISTNAIDITVKPTNSTLRMGSNVARTLDEFRIWNSALTQPQIAANQDISVLGSTGLMLYYNFNQGVAGANNTGITSITDQSGNNRNGVFTNTALTGTVNNFVNSIVTGY